MAIPGLTNQQRHQFCENALSCIEDLAMDDSDGWHVRESWNSLLATRIDDDNDDDGLKLYYGLQKKNKTIISAVLYLTNEPTNHLRRIWNNIDSCSQIHGKIKMGECTIYMNKISEKYISRWANQENNLGY